MYRLSRTLPVALAALAFAVHLPAAAHGDDDDELCSPEGVPAALAVPAAEALSAAALGVGVQIYDCRVSAAAATGFAWVFRAPEATLYEVDTCDDDDDDDDDGHGHGYGHDDDDDDDGGCGGGDDDDSDVVGTHYVGPTWQSTSGGTVVGAAVANVPSADPAAVPWLLLSAVAHTGVGPYSEVTHIQRLFTVGGKAPATGCDAGAVGAEVRVPYEATYYFYAPE